jgi:hypothetical protein
MEYWNGDVPRIIDEIRGEPELRSLRHSIPQFNDDIDSISMFIKLININVAISLTLKAHVQQKRIENR